jgi:hypothetical protein
MHEMEEAWHKPSPYGIIVAGLPDFATLYRVADLIKRALATGWCAKNSISPGEGFDFLADWKRDHSFRFVQLLWYQSAETGR